ncbi:MAG: MraY family glycosyltransferase [Bacteroidaceae bacterium]
MNDYIDFGLVAVAFIIAFFFEWQILPKILLISRKRHLYDLPNSRKTHIYATPRLAGVSFMPIVLFSSLFSLFIYAKTYSYFEPFFSSNIDLSKLSVLQNFLQELCMLICGMLLLLLVGVKDDLIGVRFRIKFEVQIIAALCLTLSGVYFKHTYGILLVNELPMYLGIPFSIFVIVLVTNAVNLIDGIDGLASGLCIIATGAFGISFFLHGFIPHSVLSFACMGLLIPFFYYNVFKRQERKLFMGDTGSLTLGFILSYLTIRHSMVTSDFPNCVSHILLPWSVLFIPAFDVARVMLHRKIRHQPMFKPDRNHLHHKLLDVGLSHRRAMVSIVSASALLLCFNMIIGVFININFIIILDFLIAISFNKWLSKKIRKKEKENLN